MANGGIVEALYVGFGDYLAGAPARDMTASEWLALPDEVRTLGLALGLYQVVVDGAADGRQDADLLDDDAAGAQDDGRGHRDAARPRRRQAKE